MKRIIFILPLYVFVVIMNSCSTSPAIPEPKISSFTAFALSSTQQELDSSLTELTVKMEEVLILKGSTSSLEPIGFVRFKYKGNAVLSTLFPGDEGHSYELFSSENPDSNSNKGIAFAKSGVMDYQYTKAGTYNATLVVTNWAEKGNEKIRKTKNIVVKVVE